MASLTLEGDELARYLWGNLALSGLEPSLWGKYQGAALKWLQALWQEGMWQAPWFVVFDLGVLLSVGSSALRTAAPGDPSLASYQARLLARLQSAPWFKEWVEVLDEVAIPYAIELCLRDVDWSDVVGVRARVVALKGVGQPSRIRGGEGYLMALAEAEPSWQLGGLRQSVVRAIGNAWPPKNGARELELLRSLPQFGSRSERLKARQLAQLITWLGEIDAQPSHREGHRSTHLNTEGAYPIGGVSSISTQGGLENLLPSELALMGEAWPDLFLLKYLEKSLLYFSREEGALKEQHRKVLVLLERSPHFEIVLSPGRPQVGVLLEGLVELILRGLRGTLGAAWTGAVAIYGGEERAIEALWQLRFAQEIRRGDLAISLVDEVEPWLESHCEADEAATLLYFGPRPSSSAVAQRLDSLGGLEVTWVHVRGAGELKGAGWRKDPRGCQVEASALGQREQLLELAAWVLGRSV